MSSLKQTATGTARVTGATLLVLIGAPLLALGVPLFWVFLASKVAGTDPHINPALAVFITTGVLVSYWAIMLVAMAVRKRFVSEEQDLQKVRRMSWNRSFRDEPYRPGEHKSDPVERLFVITAVAGFIAFEIWLLFFAGSPLPSQPLI